MIVDLRDDARRATPNVDALGDPGLLRVAAVATWAGRMRNEYGSSRVFDALAGQARRAGLLGAADECVRFADEERTHGILCGAVVEALGGVAVMDLEDAPPLPEHEDATPRVAVLRNAVSVGCMSETVAVALVGAERAEMPEGELRDLLTRIWSDEIGHARFGWRMLAEHAPSLSTEERDQLRRYVPVALAHLDAHELAHLPERHAPPGGRAWGLCSGLAARALYRATVAEVIAPRLAAALG